MKELLSFDTDKLITNYEADTSHFRMLPPYEKNKKMFIPHCLALFATIPLVKNKLGLISAKDTLAAIPSEHITKEGVFTKNQIIDLMYVFAKLPRSKLTSQVNYAALCPTFMYAHKLYNNVCYSKWDRTDPKIGGVTSTFLSDAIHNSWDTGPLLADDPKAMRRSLLKAGKKYTDYPYRFMTWEDTLDPTDGEKYGDTLEYRMPYLTLELQLWHAHAEKRDIHTMLLDVNAFGRIPKALDAVEPKITHDGLRQL